MEKITGKVAIVTGGSRGIGAAIVEKLAVNGFDVAVIYAGNVEAAERVCQVCSEKYGVNTKAYRCNVADFEETKEIVTQIKSDFGAVYVLVNNAGVTRVGLVAMMKEVAFDEVINSNLIGAFNMIRHCTSLLLRAKTGCIINISSVSGLMGNAGQSNYAASKAGMIGLTKSVAKELASKNIRCNAIAPGFIQTDMTETQADNPLMERIPMGRMGEPEDVAEAVWYLVQAKYVTGEVLRVDGGLGM